MLPVLCQDDVIRGLWADRAKLLAYIRAFVIDLHAAEDIHQEIIMMALQKGDGIDDQQHLLAWARRVAKHKAIEFLRRQGRQAQHVAPDVLDLLEPKWEAQGQIDSRVMTKALNDCIHELSPRAKEMISLRFAERITGEEIAKRLRLKIQSVYMALSRIYRALGECVQQKLVGEGQE
jgi:RNA polymerase sigma-70 factor, ECF subfamily